MDGTLLTGTFSAAELYLSPESCLDTVLSQRPAKKSLNFMSWFVFRHALSTIGPYIDKCVVFQSMSSQLNLSQVDSANVGETSGC